MSAQKVVIPHKVSDEKLYAEEVNALTGAVNEHADELDVLSRPLLASEVTNPAQAEAINLTARQAVLRLLNLGTAGSVKLTLDQAQAFTAGPAVLYVIGDSGATKWNGRTPTGAADVVAVALLGSAGGGFELEGYLLDASGLPTQRVDVDVAAGTYQAIATNAIPLTGTEQDKPVTGNVEFATGKGLVFDHDEAQGQAGWYTRLYANNGLHVETRDADDNLTGQTYIYSGQYVLSGAVPLIGFAQDGNAAYGVLSLENGRFKLNLPLDAPNHYSRDEVDAKLQAITGLDAQQQQAIQQVQQQLASDDDLLTGILSTQQQQTNNLGPLGSLLSTAKSSLVNAFNELWQKAALLAANQTFTGTNTFVLPVVGDTYQGTGGQHLLTFSRTQWYEGPTFRWNGVDRVQLNFVGGSSGNRLVFVYEVRDQYMLNAAGNSGKGEFYLSNPVASTGSGHSNQATAFFLASPAVIAVRNGARFGVGTDAPSEAAEVANGNLRISQAGKGLIFPDGTVQTTAATGNGGGGSGPAYTAGEGIDITGGIISTTGNPLALKSYNRALLSYIQSVGGGTTVNFDVIQDGTHISGGVFTAPADGLYTVQTSLVMTGTSAGAACNVGVYVNGQERAKVGQLLLPGGNYAFPDSSRTLKLHAGDQVSVVAATDAGQVFGSTQYQVTTFTVFQTA